MSLITIIMDHLSFDVELSAQFLVKYFLGMKALFRLIQNDSNDDSMKWVLKLISAKIDDTTNSN